MEQGKVYLINASIYSVTAILNQIPISLSSLAYRTTGAPTQGDTGLNTHVVDYVNGSNVSGQLGATGGL